MVGTAPPIAADTLRTLGYDDAALRRAITEGIGVDGRTLNYYMPRWELSDTELQALIDYLAGL